MPRECGDPCTAQSGAVNVLYGSPSGLSGSGSELWSQDSAGAGGLVSDGNQLWTQDSPGILESAEEQDEFSEGLMAP